MAVVMQVSMTSTCGERACFACVSLQAQHAAAGSPGTATAPLQSPMLVHSQMAGQGE